MGIRFRKSVKIAPGVKVNFGKKSSSVSFGGKGFHHTISSSGRRTTTAGIPGTGISYSQSSGSYGKRTKSSSRSSRNNTSGKSSGGCLTIILAFFAICLALLIYSYAWIPAIGFLIYFAVRKNTPNRLVKIIASSVVLITSALLCIGINSKSDLDQIDASWPGTTFDINDSVIVTVNPYPSDAEIENLVISENDIASMDYKDGIVTISFLDTGTASIYFTANDSIKSKSTEITVIDKEAEEQKRLEEESRLQAEKEAAEKAAEEERIAREQLEQQEAQQEESMQTENEQQPTPESERIVYWTPNGGSYHFSQSCPTLSRSKTIYSGTIAESGKSDPCDRCS